MKLYIWSFPVLFAAVLGSGCATFHSRPLDPDKTAVDFESRSLTDPGLRTYLSKSITGEPVLNLDTLTLVAFYYHPDLHVARAQWGVTQAGRRTAGERPNPSLSVAPE